MAKKTIQNPWQGIKWSNTVCPIDKQFIVGKYGSITAFEKKYSSAGLNMSSCLPDPFWGDVNSDVYCLFLNPGIPDCNFSVLHDTGDVYENYQNDMLNHRIRPAGVLYDSTQRKIIYDTKSYPSIIATPKAHRPSLPIRPHDGDFWRRDITESIRQCLGREPRIFNIDYFPYHSTRGFNFPNKLPSYDYRNWLIQQAMINHKVIIITRSEKLWFSDPIIGKDLQNYPNKVFLSCKQRVWLTQNNAVFRDPDISLRPNWACKCWCDVLKHC